MILLLVVLGAIVVAGLLVLYFRYVSGLGLIGGRRQTGTPAVTGRGPTAREPMSPLGGIARIYSTFFVLVIIFVAWRLKDGFYGNGPNGAACVDTGITNATGRVALWRARPGSSLAATGNVQACVLHPTAAQWLLFSLTQLPGLLLWAGVLLMILRVVRHAAQHGPFTPRGAVLMVRLGWLIIGGCVVAGILTTLGASLLTDTVITPRPFDGWTVVLNALLDGPLRALLPVPALAGVALLSFASMTRAGAVMDEELRATV
jgi:hypothetical protein